MGKKRLHALADRGYYSGPELKACDDAGITAYVSKPMTSNAKAHGRFSKADFVYIAKVDAYRCPAGERLHRGFDVVERGLITHIYAKYGCGDCPLKTQCTTGNSRKIRRWEHEAVTDAVQRRMEKRPEVMLLRKRTVEHVFGTIKHWMGWTHFLTRGTSSVSTEMSLHVLAYNLKRVLSILGMPKTMKAMQLVGA